jgi:hypothetical protein
VLLRAGYFNKLLLFTYRFIVIITIEINTGHAKIANKSTVTLPTYRISLRLATIEALGNITQVTIASELYCLDQNTPDSILTNKIGLRSY